MRSYYMASFSLLALTVWPCISDIWTKNELLEHCAGKCWCPFFRLFSGHYSPAKLLFLHTLNWAHFSSQLPSFVLLSFFSNLLMPHWTDRITILILGFRNSKDNIIRDFITFFCDLDCSVVKHDFWIAFNTFYKASSLIFLEHSESDFGAKNCYIC